jgi:imidazolonepropionase-like amidohydrolase
VATAAGDSEHVVLRGGLLPGGARADVEIRDGIIIGVGEIETRARSVDVSGSYLVPGFIDSHVHLALYPVGERLSEAGVAAAVDMASPIEFLARGDVGVRAFSSGPMITAVGGYPTQSWGSDGYGIECADVASARAAVTMLVDRGARLIKIPLMGSRGLDANTARAVVDAAHERGVLVAAHALSDSDALAAARAGADVLAHTPVERLSDQTIAAWASRAVVSTLDAFGGSASAVANLSALRAGGATVLYGTDLGNSRHVGISPAEIRLLTSAGLDGAAIIAAGTTSPSHVWRVVDLGAIAVGNAARIYVVDGDPMVDPQVLASARPAW